MDIEEAIKRLEELRDYNINFVSIERSFEIVEHPTGNDFINHKHTGVKDLTIHVNYNGKKNK